MGFLVGKRPADLGINNGQLKSVANNPQNSVSSQTDVPANKIDPFAAGADPSAAFKSLAALVQSSKGAVIVEQTDTYLYAEFQTRLLKFVDDVEFFLDPAAAVIHVRSASRLGRKDFDVNRNRIESLRSQLTGSIGSTETIGSSTNPTAAASPTQAAASMAASPAKPSNGETSVEFKTLPNGLQVADLEIGDGAEAAAGQQVSVHYTGWLYVDGAAGEKFDSSKDRGQPFQFGLGAGQVIRGWDEGVVGMKVGGKRQLIIPPEMGYGARGAGGVIPPNATLLFEVELLGV